MDDRLVRTAYRVRSRALCRSGRHLWALRRNPEVGGKDAVFETCRRCGKERQQYGPPSMRAWGWFGAG